MNLQVTERERVKSSGVTVQRMKCVCIKERMNESSKKECSYILPLLMSLTARKRDRRLLQLLLLWKTRVRQLLLYRQKRLIYLFATCFTRLEADYCRGIKPPLICVHYCGCCCVLPNKSASAKTTKWPFGCLVASLSIFQ